MACMGIIDIHGSREVQATVLSLRQMAPELRKRIYKNTREKIRPEWRQELSADATTNLEQRVIAGPARADVTSDGVRLKAATSTKKLSGGASPKMIGHAVEFGAKWRRGVVASVSSKGKRYDYERTLNKQLKPRRSAGYVAWPAALRLAPRFMSLWIQTTVRTMHDAIERKL